MCVILPAQQQVLRGILKGIDFTIRHEIGQVLTRFQVFCHWQNTWNLVKTWPLLMTFSYFLGINMISVNCGHDCIQTQLIDPVIWWLLCVEYGSPRLPAFFLSCKQIFFSSFYCITFCNVAYLQWSLGACFTNSFYCLGEFPIRFDLIRYKSGLKLRISSHFYSDLVYYEKSVA